MRKLGCILSFMLILSMVLFTGCDKKDDKKTIIETQNAVANITIYTIDKADQGTLPLLFNLGHAFLSIDNTSDSDLNIGNYTVSKDNSVCFGTWSISSHFGVWFNVESNYQYKYDRYNGRVSVTKSINQDDIDKINAFISEHDKWNPIQNCSYFALNLWNEIAKPTEVLSKPLIYTPSHIAKQLRCFDNVQENRDFGKTQPVMGYYQKTQFVSFNMKGEDKYV